MHIDLSDEDGIQDEIQIEDSSGIVAVSLRIESAEELYSYQCKVAFDTAYFTFKGAEQDFGIGGEENILLKNGGSCIGIFQRQQNPPR